MLVIDVSGRREMTAKIAADLSYTAPVLLDDKGFSRTQYNITATPTTFVVDQMGRMVFKHLGYGPGMESIFEREIDLLLARRTS